MMTIVLQGWSPLYGASINGHLDVVKTLLKAGANIDQASNVGAIAPVQHSRLYIKYSYSTVHRPYC